MLDWIVHSEDEIEVVRIFRILKFEHWKSVKCANVIRIMNFERRCGMLHSRRLRRKDRSPSPFSSLDLRRAFLLDCKIQIYTESSRILQMFASFWVNSVNFRDVCCKNGIQMLLKFHFGFVEMFTEFRWNHTCRTSQVIAGC